VYVSPQEREDELAHGMNAGMIAVLTFLVHSLIDATGAERAAGYKAMVDEFHQWGELSEETKRLTKEQMTDQLAELHAAQSHRHVGAHLGGTWGTVWQI
jgi:acid phosphatase family membrane protein YuiD